VIYLLNLVPWEAGGVLDRILKTGAGITARDDVKPIAITAVCGDTAL
jgi:hypothetical protein